MPPGTYTVVVALPHEDVVTFGAAGDRRLRAGYYAYTGSAFGAGGLGRVDRHREVAAGDRDVRHWHVDHLLRHPETGFVDAHTTEREDRECAVARVLSDACTPVPGLGASDCDCDTHLAYCADRERLSRLVRDAHD